jgi:hypothetical protein
MLRDLWRRLVTAEAIGAGASRDAMMYDSTVLSPVFTCN